MTYVPEPCRTSSTRICCRTLTASRSELRDTPPIRRSAGGRREYTEDDLFRIGLVTCFREAGLGIADLREFVAILRSEHSPQDRVAFLRERRAALEQQVAALRRAMNVLDEKIASYS
ncbi:MerR family DNA-binding protein [Streptomyces sp. NBC_00090]